MPARHSILIIVLFWLASTAWLFHREFWPHWRGGEAPPFTIDLAYEAQRHALPSSWSIIRGQERLGFIHTWVIYKSEDDTFELHSGPLQSSSTQNIKLVETAALKVVVSDMQGMYRVTREGELRQMKGKATVTLSLGHTPLAHVVVDIGGDVKDGMFIPYGTVDWGSGKQKLDLEPVPFTSRDSILNPMHPLSRIGGLRPGQHWQLKPVNPLADSFATLAEKMPGLEFLLQKDPRAKVLAAEVLPDIQILIIDQIEVPCLVIEYKGDDLAAHTWVRASDGKVMRQEATLWGVKLILERL